MINNEKFMNAGGICYVLERSVLTPTTSLVYRPCNRLTPFIVAIYHEINASSWGQGKYFATYDDAIQEFNSWDNRIE